MGFKFQERHMFDIEGVGSFEYDINNIDALESIQQGYPEILACLADGQRAMREYVEYCASLGIDDPTASTTEDLAAAVIKKADEQAIQKTGELNDATKTFRDKAYEKCVEFIRGCLGDDAYSQMFDGGGRYLDDHVALCKALYDEAVTQRDSMVLAERAKLKELMGQSNAVEETPDGDTGTED